MRSTFLKQRGHNPAWRSARAGKERSKVFSSSRLSEKWGVVIFSGAGPTDTRNKYSRSVYQRKNTSNTPKIINKENAPRFRKIKELKKPCINTLVTNPRIRNVLPHSFEERAWPM